MKSIAYSKTYLSIVILGIPVPCFAQIAHSNKITPLKIKTDVNSILKNPDYQWKRPGTSFIDAIGKIIYNLLQKLQAFLQRLFPHARLPVTAPNPIMAKILLTLFSLVIVILLAWLITILIKRKHIRWNRAERQRLKIQRENPDEYPIGMDQPEDMLAHAKALLEKGELRKSYRYAFLAILLLLDQKGLIQYEKSRTNGEYLRSLRRKMHVYPVFRTICQDFDVRWYGNRVVDSSACNSFIERYECMQDIIRENTISD